MIRLTTKRLIIRDPLPTDIDDWHRLMSDPKTMYYLQDIMTHSLEESRQNLAVAVAESQSANRTKYFLSIEDATTGAFIGTVGYTVTQAAPVGKLVGAGYFILPEYHGQGYTTEALRAVIRFAFEDDGVYRISTGCLVENRASERVMQKCGFIKEAEYKSYVWHDGRMKDRVEYRLLRDEWPLALGLASHACANMAGGKCVMRTEQEMMDLILNVAKADERIRAVRMEGSRANPAVPKDIYQDYDISYYVTDIAPFYNNPAWVIEHFGKPLIMQMPESMRYPDGGGYFNYMMTYPDGNRLDLIFQPEKYVPNGEPSVVLLDKDNGNGFLPQLPPPNDAVYHIKPPDELFYHSCCNNFWWCLNNVAKGIARDELSYVMHMLNAEVRSELHDMMNWYIGIQHGFNISTGKDGKYFKRYLPPELYAVYAATYSGSDYDDIWAAVFTMCDLLHMLALPVAAHFGFTYRQEEEDGIREYLRMVRDGAL